MKVDIIIANRNGLGVHQESFEFDSFDDLNKHVEALIEEVPFYKVEVELIPDSEWEPTKEEEKKLDDIEYGEYA